MSRSEIVSRFVAAIASNPSHSNETVPNIVDMAEELADEVEKRPDCKEPKYCCVDGMIIREEHYELYMNKKEELNNEPRKKWFVAPFLQTITLILCGIVLVGILIYGFINACRWVWNFYS